MKAVFRKFFPLALLFFGGALFCAAFEISGGDGGPSDFRLKIGGEISALLRAYPEEFRRSGAGEIRPRDLFSSRLKFNVSGPAAEWTLNLKLVPAVDGSPSPVHIDETYFRLYLGAFQFEGGLRKLTWGKADSFGPLDVVNPLDYSDPSAITDAESRKIARPLFRLSWMPDGFSRLEGVFVPFFQGYRYAAEGRWVPRQMGDYRAALTGGLEAMVAQIPSLPPGIQASLHPAFLSPGGLGDIASFYGTKYLNASLDSLYPDTALLKYAQGGLRFTTTLGQTDLGLQYFCGNLFRPAVGVTALGGFYQNPYGLELRLDYNRYHQIGLDYARVLGDFNIRAEAAVNITSDLHGDDGEVYNPFLGWSLGFDRDLFWGINLNLQGTGTVRLLHDRLGDNPLTDTEAGKNLSATRIIFLLSKKFFRDELEIKTLGLWGIEDRDVYLVPALVWVRDDLSLELAGGIFAGRETGELGQYRDNSFVKITLTFQF